MDPRGGAEAFGRALADPGRPVLDGWRVAVVVAQLTKQAGRVVASVVLAALLAVAGYWLWDSFTLYNSGVYKLTGAGFRAGAILLPGLLTLVFGQALFDVTQAKPKRR